MTALRNVQQNHRPRVACAYAATRLLDLILPFARCDDLELMSDSRTS
jgi:hypothetical protein